jgi:hypothetical protein
MLRTGGDCISDDLFFLLATREIYSAPASPPLSYKCVALTSPLLPSPPLARLKKFSGVPDCRPSQTAARGGPPPAPLATPLGGISMFPVARGNIVISS